MGVSVIRKLAAAVTVATLAMGGVGFASAPAGAAKDPYQARMKTRTTVTVPVQIRPGTFIPTRVAVDSHGVIAPAAPDGSTPRNAAEPPVVGTVRLTYTRVGGGFRHSMVKEYAGSPIRFPGPQLVPTGRYRVSAVYSPAADSIYRGSSDTDTSRVRGGAAPDPDPEPGPSPTPDGGDNPGGLLPDTGGPDFGWLLLGLALVGSGLLLVVAARARREAKYLV